jgi:hypothetical protein
MENKNTCPNVYSETVTINCEVKGIQRFELTCPFIPDYVEVQAALGNYSYGNRKLRPIQLITDGEDIDIISSIGGNIFLINLSCLPASRAVVASVANTYNPLFCFSNTNNNSFCGNFTCNAYNSRGDTFNILNGGQVILSFKYVKY